MSSSKIRNIDQLARSDMHKHVIELLEEGLRAADPYLAVKRVVERVGQRVLRVAGEEVLVEGVVHAIGFGKASAQMARAVVDSLGDLVVGGVVIAPEGGYSIGPIEVLKGDHPIPGENTLRSSLRLLEYLRDRVEERDIVFVLVSGGGSALFEVPVEGVELRDLAELTRELMKRGADIVELNAVRKHLSQVKGGGLLRFIKAHRVFSLIVSDVVGDRLDTIASGPTVADETTYEDAYRVLVRRGLWDSLPPKIRERIEKGLRGEAPETVKPGDPLLKKVRNIVVASNVMSLEAMARRAEELGYRPLILTPFMEGEAREVGKVLAAVIKSVKQLGKPLEPPAAILAGGETTVTVKGSGVGGRNQELCLSLALRIDGIDRVVAACMGSDGVDGVSPAAGAVVDGAVCREARERGLDPVSYLDNNDSYTFFKELGRAIMTGYTGTNVNDFFIALIR